MVIDQRVDIVELDPGSLLRSGRSRVPAVGFSPTTVMNLAELLDAYVDQIARGVSFVTDRGHL